MIEHDSEEEKKKRRNKEIQSVLSEAHERNASLLPVKLDIQRLKELVKEWVVDSILFDEIVKDGSVTEQELKDIIQEVELEVVLNKIDEIEQYESLPPSLKISRAEFAAAMTDPHIRAQVLQKLDDVLSYLYTTNQWSHKPGWNLFSSLLYLYDKKLQVVQSHAIDLKVYLGNKWWTALLSSSL